MSASLVLPTTGVLSGLALVQGINAALAELLSRIPAALPAGMLLPFAGGTLPDGYLLANGSPVSRTSYAALYAAIGVTYGAGDGSTTFNLPDGRGVVLRGLDNGRGLDTGRALGSYQADSFASHGHGVNDPSHAHGVSDPGHGHGVNDPGHAHTFGRGGAAAAGTGANWTDPNYNFVGNQATSASGTGISIGRSGTGIGIYGSGTGVSVQASGGSETRGKNLAVNFIIKY